ncbi:oxidoreductase [Bryobacterales bacterium F-183]|nr:oxidoreductase [Bryobacterales bacterium F-183]
MQKTNNTILMTGGGSGIGRALAEAFASAGNQVIITGRDTAKLQSVIAANPGIHARALDVTDSASIDAFAQKIVQDFPTLNVVINNAGIMQIEDIKAAPGNLKASEATVATNILGPIRLTSALLPHLLQQPDSTVAFVTSGLAFVPMSATPTYSASKSAMHAYAVSLRHQLKGTSVKVMEIIPPYVQTELMGPQQASDPHAMPLADYIAETMSIIQSNPDVEEVVVERCKRLRFAVANGTFDEVFRTLNP